MNQATLRKWAEYLFRTAAGLRKRAQRLLTEILLLKYCCPQCSGRLQFIADKVAECTSCHVTLDPTLEFQRCGECGRKLVKKRYYYWCPECRTTQRSMFSLDNWIYFPEYFAEKMRDSRQAKRRKKEALKQLLASARSTNYAPRQIDLKHLHGLDKALATFIQENTFHVSCGSPGPEIKFNLQKYRSHIVNILPQSCTIHFDGISPVIPDQRLDRIFRFITLIYMWHYGEVSLIQVEELIKVERI